MDILIEKRQIFIPLVFNLHYEHLYSPKCTIEANY